MGRLIPVILLSGFLLVDFSAVNLMMLPLPGELLYATIGMNPGGHPDNVALTLARLGHDGKDVTVFGTVGRDELGDLIEHRLASFGISSRLKRTEGSTGVTLALSVRGRDRSFIADPGANASFDADALEALLRELKPDIFYMASGALGEADGRVAEVLALAKREGSMTFGDLVRRRDGDWGFAFQQLTYLDVFHVNASEAADMTGAGPEDAARALSRAGAGLAVVTKEDGLSASWDGGRQSLTQAGFRVEEVLDTTGAGDAFVAGLIEKVSKEGLPSTREEIEEQLLFAQAVAAVKVSGVSTTAISSAAVEKMLQKGERQKSNVTRRAKSAGGLRTCSLPRIKKIFLDRPSRWAGYREGD